MTPCLGSWFIIPFLYHGTVKPVYKGNSGEAKNVPFMRASPLYTG
jgi:hypothetical protein